MQHSIRRIAQGTVWLFAAAVASGANAQGYPNKPIRVIVTNPAGGAVDIIARMLGQQLGDTLGKFVIVDNRGGAAGIIGADIVAKANPDGYTLLIPNLSTFTAVPAVYPSLPFDPLNDFAPITMLIFSPNGIAVYPGLPVSSFQGLITYAKSNPGKLNFAHAGTGSVAHLAAIELARRAGISWTYIPYKGGAQALPAVASGEAQVVGIALLSTLTFVRRGNLRLLAVSSRERLSFLPDVPTVIESGYPGFIAGLGVAVFAPKGTPKDIIAKLRAEIVRIMSALEMKNRLSDQGTEVATSTPEELGRLVADEKTMWAKVVKHVGVRFD